MWGATSGLVTVAWLPKGGNVTGQLLFTMYTWSLFSHIGYLYINRWDVDDNVSVPIQPDSSQRRRQPGRPALIRLWKAGPPLLGTTAQVLGSSRRDREAQVLTRQ